MNLVSCGGCGVVLDKDHLHFYIRELDEGGFDPNTCEWDGKDYVAKLPCPVCEQSILETK